jgi:hypothetical protein
LTGSPLNFLPPPSSISQKYHSESIFF